MSKFTSPSVRVDRPASEISEKFSDLTQLQSVVDQLPESERSKIGDISFSQNAISLNTAQVGAIRFEIVERTSDIVRFKAAGAPVDVQLLVELKEAGESATDMVVAVEMQIPMMLRPMIAPHMQKAVDMLSSVIANVASR